jgi:hypothetical protein
VKLKKKGEGLSKCAMSLKDVLNITVGAGGGCDRGPFMLTIDDACSLR